jgi:selenoprotein W-related protein
MKDKPMIEIHYCVQCRWLLRASWYGNELLTTFQDHLEGVCLKPASGGVFQIFCNRQLIWCRKENEGFPDIKDLKQRVRDLIDPSFSLGHSDL